MKLEAERSKCEKEKLQVETSNLKLQNHLLAYEVFSKVPASFSSNFVHDDSSGAPNMTVDITNQDGDQMFMCDVIQSMKTDTATGVYTFQS